MLKRRKPYWIGLIALLIIVGTVYAFVIRPWHMHWGATDQDGKVEVYPWH